MEKHPIFGHTLASYPMAHQNHPISLHAPVVHVAATIKNYEGIATDHTGATHQHLIITIDKVLDIHGGDASIVKGDAFVAIRFGDNLGLKSEIPGLAEGQPIEMQGEYIDANHAYPSTGNPGDAVIHFTHHPVGYILYQGQKYS